MSKDSDKSSQKPNRWSSFNRGTPKFTVQLPEVVRQALERRASNQRTTTVRILIEILTEQLAEEIQELEAEEEKEE